MNTPKNISITVPRSTIRVLEKMAKEEKISRNQLLQKALRGYKETRRLKSIQTILSSRAKSTGIRTEEDVERLVDEIRR